MTPNTFPQPPHSKLGRTAPPRTRLDWAIVASITLMLAVNLVALFGDLGPATAYAAVPM
jgi:hypothetical protein